MRTGLGNSETCPRPMLAEPRDGSVAWSQLVNFAGGLTISRLLIAIVFPFLMSHWLLALFAYLIAVSTDVLDGYVARRTGTDSPAGAILDGWVDKVLHVNVIWSMVNAEYLPGWWMALLFSREILQLPLVAALPGPIYEGHSPLHPPVLSGKIASFLFVVLIVSLFMGFPGPSWSLTLAIAAFGTIAALEYLYREFVPGFRTGSVSIPSQKRARCDE